jgi:ADP-dependent NAD(P)H-hydrate dehydratase / NAD(P)H-hydrate epimerase
MKILSVDSILKADKYTIENEPISSVDLMERAGLACSDELIHLCYDYKNINIFVGNGNNGGDGLVIARLLSNIWQVVNVFIIENGSEKSPDFKVNFEKLAKTKKVKIRYLNSIQDFPNLNNDDLVIDAIFGSGLTRPVQGFIAEIISKINESLCFTVAVDIPSGFFADYPTNEKEGAIIYADQTLSLQFPKLMMLVPESERFIGNLKIVDIGLSPEFIDNVQPAAVLLDDDIIGNLLKRRSKFSHKGNFGHALLIAGGKLKPGAAVLSSIACLRAGAGLLTLHSVESVGQALINQFPEAMLSIDSNAVIISHFPDLSPYNSIGIGPGIGMENATAQTFKLLIQNSSSPLLIDADALNILSENKTWLAFLPAGSILTPHPKEFDRLFGNSDNTFERIQKQISFSKKLGVFIILKGAHTIIACPDGAIYFNNTGNPGMSTAGSGDVLTGIILGLLAQNYSSHDAAVIGVYIHGLAGDYALKVQSEETMVASDIILGLAQSFKFLHEK